MPATKSKNRRTASSRVRGDDEGRRLAREVRRRGGSVPVSELFSPEVLEAFARRQRRARLIEYGVGAAVLATAGVLYYIFLRPKMASASSPAQLAGPGTGRVAIDQFGRAYQLPG